MLRRTLTIAGVLISLAAAPAVFAHDGAPHAEPSADTTVVVIPTDTPAAVVVPLVPEPVVVPIAPPKQPTILDAVVRGKELLAPIRIEFKDLEPKYAAKGGTPLKDINSFVPAALAVWNKQTDAITVIRGKRDAKKFVSNDGAITYKRIGGSGTQAAYRGDNASEIVVGAVQPDLIGTKVKKKTVYELHFAYYVPYVRELYTPATLTAGSDYLSYLVKDAFDDLATRNIRSRAFPDRMVTEVIDPYLVKAIAVIEHADGQIYDEDGSEDSLGRFLVKLALNKEDALDTALSVAGARGLVQFIPSTYKLMVTRRPDLALIPDFQKGMVDHRNAIRAEVGYLDMELAALPEAIRKLHAIEPGKAAEFLAASYNGGSPRVRKAYLLLGQDWSKDQTALREQLYQTALTAKNRIAQIDKKLKAGKLTAAETKKLKAEKATLSDKRYAANQKRAALENSSLRRETVGYVVKLRRVYDMLAAGYFATPAAPSGALPTTALVAIAR